jgi:hypothetical protein
MKQAPRPGVVLAFAVAAILASPAFLAAQADVPSPLVPRADPDRTTGLPALDADAARVALLAGMDEVRLTDFALPGGARADLLLGRVDLARLGFGFRVDGLPAPDLLDGLDLSVWTGTVAGVPGSEAVLGFSRRGVHGWVRTDGEAVHLLPRAGAGNDWSAATVLLATEADLAARGLQPGPLCALDPTAVRPGADGRPGLDVPPTPPGGRRLGTGANCDAWECSIAVETDFQFYDEFGDLGAATSYLTTLLAAVSARYEEQVRTILVYPYVQLYTTPADPWSTPDGPGASDEMLFEFAVTWAGAVPEGAVLGHFVSGANLGGGIAFLGVLCDTSHTATFAVSGNMHGETPFPIEVGPLNWDFVVFAHETGHNFSSPHTHDYSPPIDLCAFGQCITDGTIMGYCHLCPGGLANVTTYFQEPTVTGVMMTHASSCLPYLAPLVAEEARQPDLVPPDGRTTLSVDAPGTPVSRVDLNYRHSPADDYTAIPMVDQGNGTWVANLPPPACDETPEWFYSVVDLECGPYQTPVHTAEVGVATTELLDEFEADSGWTAGIEGDDATTGLWERGDPVGTAAQPENDVTPSGTDCWFTGQGEAGGGLGDNDVDGGRTTLVSPPIPLLGEDARISYWRWFSNDTGGAASSDVFEVQITDDGVQWVTAETVGPLGTEASGGWFRHQFRASDFVSVAANVQVRFVASDEGSGSIVEAAIDDFEVFRVDCWRTCQHDLGFGGPGTASMWLCGGDLSTGQPADLELVGATPDGTAVLLAGLVLDPTATKGGVLVPVPWFVTALLPLDAAGAASLMVPGGGGPLTIFVQAMYADPAQAQGFGFSNALSVKLLP